MTSLTSILWAKSSLSFFS